VQTADRFLAVHNLSLLQRQAGVDPEVAELVTAYARILTDADQPLVFEHEAFESDAPEHEIHQQLIANNPSLDGRFLSFLAAYGGAMERRGLPVIFSVTHFCHYLDIDRQKLMQTCANQRKCYREFRIPKQNGQSRIILAPWGTLRRLQAWIQQSILSRVVPHPCAHGFVRGRSIVSNAAEHAGRRVVVRMDVEDFFPSITHRPIRKVFEQLGYPYRVAVLLTNLCTVDGRLPQGAITSPALSNFVCEKLDRRLAGLSKTLSFRYTRYADDLIFSSDNPKLPSLIPFFREILLEEGFRVQESKTKVMRQSRRQMVTGIVVNKRPNLRREHVRRLRAAVHTLHTKGPSAVSMPSRRGSTTDPMHVLCGHIGFLNMVHPEKAPAYKLDFPYVQDGL
jgi:RNA-directed DNA polymerase